MKPCTNNRKLLVWLALEELDTRQAEALRSHLQTCRGCRQYLMEISNVTKKLAAAQISPDVQASEFFHRELVARLREEKSESVRETTKALFRAGLLNWRVALPVAAAMAVLAVGLVVQRQHSRADIPLPVQSTARVVPGQNPDTDLPPTIANYQMAANQSLEKLDALLTAQARKALPPALVYTASMLTLGNTTH
jgi:anti-sigma factor RsiW